LKEIQYWAALNKSGRVHKIKERKGDIIFIHKISDIQSIIRYGGCDIILHWQTQ